MCTVKDKIFIIGGESEQGNMEDPAYIYYLEIRKCLHLYGNIVFLQHLRFLPSNAKMSFSYTHASSTAKIRFHDSPPVTVPPRQVSSSKPAPNRPNDGTTSQQHQQQFQEESGMESESERNSGQPPAPTRPERPERPARPVTQRPSSPATFGKGPTNGNMSASQQAGQPLNSQLGQRPLTMGTPPPRGASAGFQNNLDQDEGLSTGTRRQDMDAGYGIASVFRIANPIGA
jgi:hypothetical protein